MVILKLTFFRGVRHTKGILVRRQWIDVKFETWVHQWKHTGSPPPQTFKRVYSEGKMMASDFRDSKEVIIIDYLEQGCMINGAYYAGELRWLCQENTRKRRGKLTRGILLLLDNTPAHTSQVDMTAAIECGFEILPHIAGRLSLMGIHCTQPRVFVMGSIRSLQNLY